MSGIVGAWGLEDPGGLIRRLGSAAAAMPHRGRSTAFLSASRLSAAVLSDHEAVPAGKARIFQSDEIAAAVAGHFENEDELLGSLDPAAPASDGPGALLARHWLRGGGRSVQAFRGAFAAVLADERRQELVLVRDSYGVAPLFYRRMRRAVLFASEIRGLLALGIPRRVNTDRLPDFFRYGLVVGGPTLLEGVHSVPAGGFVRFLPDGQTRAESYYEFPEYTPETRSIDEWATLVWRALLEVTTRKARMFRSPAVLLSGGVDSPIMAAALKEVGAASFPALTGGFAHRQLDEGEAAARVAGRLGLPHVYVQVESTGQSLLDGCSRLIWQQEHPTRFINAVSPDAVFEAAVRRHPIDGVFAGDEADTLYGGRSHLLARRIERLQALPRLAAAGLRVLCALGGRLAWARGRIQTLAELLEQHGADPTLYLAPFCSEEFTRRVTGGDAEWTRQCVAELVGACASDRLEVVYSKVHLALSGPVMAARLERVSSHHGIEVTFPFMDDLLVGLAMRLPPSRRYHGRVAKPVLRQIMADTVGADLLPDRKIGWEPPSDHWMARDESLRRGLQILREPRTRERGIVDAEAVVRRLDEDREGGEELWSALSLEIWCRTYIDGEGRQPVQVA
jgi:asparagine synthase (glutamine-hydrolysing)